LRSAAWADGLIEVREGSTVAEGDLLNFIPLSEVFG
jgi:molybdopterin molybdotransferase